MKRMGPSSSRRTCRRMTIFPSVAPQNQVRSTKYAEARSQQITSTMLWLKMKFVSVSLPAPKADTSAAGARTMTSAIRSRARSMIYAAARGPKPALVSSLSGIGHHRDPLVLAHHLPEDLRL